MERGIERKRIFLNNKDRDDFINRLSELVKEGAIDIYAWALMADHFHLFMTKKNLKISGQRIDLEELCDRVCKKKTVSLAELVSGSRRRKLVNARRIAIMDSGQRIGIFRCRGRKSSWRDKFLCNAISVIWGETFDRGRNVIDVQALHECTLLLF